MLVLVIYGPDWVEHIEVAGDPSLRLRLRPIRPDDKEVLQRALGRMSPQSRYLRFFSGKTHLSRRELRYLTEVDGYDHFALGAVRLDAEGQEAEGVGIARFVRLPDEPRVAEPAIAVVDHMQHRGIGTLLLRRLVEAAVERGIDVFRADFLERNAPVRELLAGLAPQVSFHGHGAVVTAEVRLRPPTELAPRDPAETSYDPLSPMQHMLRLVAEQGVELRRRFRLLFDPDRLIDVLRDVRDDLVRRRSEDE